MENHGYDPVKNYTARYGAAICFFVGLVLMVGGYVLLNQAKYAFDPIRLIPVGLGMLLMLCATGFMSVFSCRREEFNKKLLEVSGYLDVTIDRLHDWNHTQLSTQASLALKQFARMIRVAEEQKCDRVAEMLKVEFGRRYQTLVFWKLVPDAGWGRYFKDL
jgi:hypothetical protein